MSTPDATSHLQCRETADALQMAMPAITALIDDADRRIASFLEGHRAEVNVFEMRILVREALLNAVIHGSGKDPSRTVAIDVTVSDDAITLTVEDEGPGFTPPVEPVAYDILGDGGRGLPLLQIYSDELQWNDRGNRVSVRKRLAGDSPAALAS